jgi:hypothetical protein
MSHNNEQILSDIQSLQQMEQQLFTSLETNTNLTSEQQQQIVDKMNQLSNMRINLYQTLGGVNNFFQNALSSSVGTLREQTVAIGIVESELNKSKQRLASLETEKNNQIRLVEINNYYGDKYAEHASLMKIIIFMLLPVIILVFLNNKGILPNTIYYILIVIVSAIGTYYLWHRFASIIMRDNMNYDEYNWWFDPSKAPIDSGVISEDPWLSLNMPGTCIGEFCCSENQKYDTKLNKCLNSATESMINNILTQKQPNKYKSDYNMSSEIKGPLAESVINK